jgi:hypothetical protein
MDHTRAVIEMPDAYEPRLVRYFTGTLGSP